jgi:hypothetical protein
MKSKKTIRGTKYICFYCGQGVKAIRDQCDGTSYGGTLCKSCENEIDSQDPEAVKSLWSFFFPIPFKDLGLKEEGDLGINYESKEDDYLYRLRESN